jgi:hypothetical protein
MMEGWYRAKRRLRASKWRAQAIKEILMPRQPIPPTAVEPDVYLSRWRTFETDDSFKHQTDDGFKHLVGSDALCTDALFRI